MTLLAFDLSFLLYFVFIPVFAIVMFAFYLVTYFVYRLTVSMIKNPMAIKENYAGRKIFSLGGLVLIFTIILCSGMLSFWYFPSSGFRSDYNQIVYQVPVQLILIMLGFGFVGLLDDLFGSKDHQGFKGHISALLKGKITTGAIKLFGGPAIALLVLYPVTHSKIELFLDVVAIALIANLFNLLDLAPGRAAKFAIFGMVGALFVHYNFEYNYWIIGIIACVLYLDVREKFMLGDVGSNALGALVGFSLVIDDSKSGYLGQLSGNKETIIILLVALGLNALSEFVSFSKIFNGFLPLRILDELGQTKVRKAFNAVKRLES